MNRPSQVTFMSSQLPKKLEPHLDPQIVVPPLHNGNILILVLQKLTELSLVRHVNAEDSVDQSKNKSRHVIIYYEFHIQLYCGDSLQVRIYYTM